MGPTDLEDMNEEILRAPPQISHAFQQLRVLLDNVDCPAREFIRVIEEHPILSQRTLDMVNSDCLGFCRSFDSVKGAMAVIGFNTLKNLVRTEIARNLDESLHRDFTRGVLSLPTSPPTEPVERGSFARRFHRAKRRRRPTTPSHCPRAAMPVRFALCHQGLRLREHTAGGSPGRAVPRPPEYSDS